MKTNFEPKMERSLAEREADQITDDSELVDGLIVGYGVPKDCIYFGSFITRNDHILDDDIHLVEGTEIPFIINSHMGSTTYFHEAYLWKSDCGWLNVRLSLVAVELGIPEQEIKDGIERSIAEGVNEEPLVNLIFSLRQRNAPPQKKEGHLV
jgi:hypothetical protein